MKAFRGTTGRVAVLDRADVDTDQIIPKQFLKRIERTGYGEFLFHDWRRDRVRAEQADPPGRRSDRGTELRLRLVASMRLGDDCGFEVIVAPSFGDIFASTHRRSGSSPSRCPSRRSTPDGGHRLTVGLEALAITGPGSAPVVFEFDPFRRQMILNGLDDISRALEHEATSRCSVVPTGAGRDDVVACQGDGEVTVTVASTMASGFHWGRRVRARLRRQRHRRGRSALRDVGDPPDVEALPRSSEPCPRRRRSPPTGPPGRARSRTTGQVGTRTWLAPAPTARR